MKIHFSAQTNLTNPYALERKAQTVYGAFTPTCGKFFNPDVYVKNPDVLDAALNALQEINFEKTDVQKVKKYGVKLIFKNGEEALKYLRENNIEVVFDKVDKDDIHAQWVNSQNKIVINEKYRNTRSMDEIYAISAALFHEISHAKDKDSLSSIQEEIDCLGMNALAFNVFLKKYPKIFNENSSPILKDGVELYTKLFLGDDKQALKKRIKLKYGDLNLESPNHKASKFAKEIINS